MSRLSKIEVISIDLFRTLVDLDQSDKLIWKIFLKDNYSEALAKTYWGRANEILFKIWDEAGINDERFKNVRTVFEETFSELFNEIHLDYDPKSAANVLVEQHKLLRPFADAKPFLNAVGGKYPVCLSTDSDLEMVANINELYSFHAVFVSEELRAYKSNPKFFQHVIRHYNVSPESILHIGDAKADIICPKQLGLLTCWLNRHDRQWEHALIPDFVVKSLAAVVDKLSNRRVG